MEIHSNFQKSWKNSGGCIQGLIIGGKIFTNFEVESLGKINLYEHLVILITILKCQKLSENSPKI